jgi:hypothetical protein
MRKLVRAAAVALVLAALSPAAAAHAAAPAASCTGQELSVLGTTFGAGVGAAVSFEAQNPQLEGHRNFGEEVSGFSHADRTACPEE